MRVNRMIILNIYFIILLAFLAAKAYRFFSIDSAVYHYFTVLMAFDPSLTILYLINLLQIIINLLHALPVLFYIHRLKIGPPQFWKILLILRVLFDITGHSYETTYLISLYYFDLKICFLVFLLSIATYIPSYIVCWRYAFARDRYLK